MPGAGYALCSRYPQKISGIGHAGRVTGEEAALAILREAAGCGSELLASHAARLQAAAPPPATWCGIRDKRAQDLTDADVIRHGGHWREVIAVYRDLEEWEELHGPLSGPDARTGPEAEAARAALDWSSPMWVLVELLSIRKSTPAEIEVDLIKLYRFDLVETQELAAWGTRPAAQGRT